MGARDCTGAIDTCLANRSRAETFRLGISLFLLLVLIDIGVNVLLREAPVLIAPPNVSLWWETDYDISWRFDDFTTQLLDFSYDTLGSAHGDRKDHEQQGAHHTDHKEHQRVEGIV